MIFSTGIWYWLTKTEGDVQKVTYKCILHSVLHKTHQMSSLSKKPGYSHFFSASFVVSLYPLSQF